jgi:hypothetical protein
MLVPNRLANHFVFAHAHGGMICAIPSSKQVIMRETRP